MPGQQAHLVGVAVVDLEFDAVGRLDGEQIFDFRELAVLLGDALVLVRHHEKVLEPEDL